MKKIGLMISLIVVLLLSACGQVDKQASTKVTNDTASANVNEPVKKLKLDIDKLYPKAEFKTYAQEFIGKKAPDFTAVTLDGKLVKLSDFKGKNVIVEIANSECPYCQQTQSVIDLYKKEQKHIPVLQVFPVDTKEAVEGFVRKTGSTSSEGMYTAVNGDSIMAKYQVHFYPIFLFVDAHGFIELVHIGVLDTPWLHDYVKLVY